MRKLGEIADKQKSVNIVKLHQALTMDVIVSAAFSGLEANSQDNPNNPAIEAACNALNWSASQRKLLALLAVLPFGIKIMEKFPHMWMSNMIPLYNLRMAEEIAVKRAGDGNLSRRKDVLDVILAVQMTQLSQILRSLLIQSGPYFSWLH